MTNPKLEAATAPAATPLLPAQPASGLNTSPNAPKAMGAAPAKGSRMRTELRSNLNQALNTWDKLTVETAGRRSPEEEQLREVKKLLGELKNKIAEFE